MLQIIISIIGILLTIFFVIGTHEAAHFFIARWSGVKVLRFSIGFGKALYKWYDKQGTEYVIALVPLGGYVKMLDENEEPVPTAELPRAFNRQPFYKKFFIVLAGPAMNILCALILYWCIFVIGFVTIKPIVGTITPDSIAAKSGMQSNQIITHVDQHQTLTWPNILFRFLVHIGNKDIMQVTTTNKSGISTTYHLNLVDWKLNELTPDPLSALGITPYEPDVPLIIGELNTNSPAATAELKVGDKIIAINNKSIKNWSELIALIQKNPNQKWLVKIIRQQKTLNIPVTIGSKRHLFSSDTGYLGISPSFEIPKELLQTIKYSPLPAIKYAWQEISDLTYFNFLLFGKLFTGKLSLQSLGGPITIFETAGTSLNYGFIPFISFLAFLSLSIGLINLLPIPGLDGGHLFLQIIEVIARRPIPERYIVLLFRLGFIFLFVILIQALVNDVLRLYT